MKQEWTSMQVKLVGEVREVVQVNNKISPPPYPATRIPELPRT